MPNIIEQQDLLKGLPDTRLALLMQNPVGSIPPFLVAAEAARRQSIRQQFAGAGSQESVVDSLTKSMAKVPENVKAPMQTPPSIPQAPMGGLAALQPQQQPQQQMAAGGPVQRYAEGTLVRPVFRGRAGAGGYDVPSGGWGILGDIYNSAATGLGSFSENMRKFGINPTPDQAAQRKVDIGVEAPKKEPTHYGMTAEDRRAATSPVKPRDPEAGQKDTSPENKQKSMEEQMRERLAAILEPGEQSNAEKAQKWFAMASQFFDPTLTTGQSIANAGLAYSQAAGQQAAAQRQAMQDQQEALLKYDMDVRARDAAAAAAERERTTMSAKDTAEVFTRRLNAMDDQISQATKALDALKADPLSDKTQVDAIEAQVKELMTARQSVAGQLSSLVEQSYGPIKYDTFSFSGGFQR